MRVVISFALLTVAAAAVCSSKPIYDLKDAPALFEKYMKDYNRAYKDEQDRDLHFEAFKTNLLKINALNSRPNQTATFGINKFTDYTEEEWSKVMGTLVVPTASPSKPIYDLNDAPALFEKYMKDYNRAYKDEQDRDLHFEAFKTNLLKINTLNSRPNQTATFGINKFTDYTEEEWSKVMGTLVVPTASPSKPIYDLKDAPALFEKYMKDYNRAYKDEQDRDVHFEAFKTNLLKINTLNSRPNQTATFGINMFTDYTEEEWNKVMGIRI